MQCSSVCQNQLLESPAQHPATFPGNGHFILINAKKNLPTKFSRKWWSPQERVVKGKREISLDWGSSCPVQSQTGRSCSVPASPPVWAWPGNSSPPSSPTHCLQHIWLVHIPVYICIHVGTAELKSEACSIVFFKQFRFYVLVFVQSGNDFYFKLRIPFVSIKAVRYRDFHSLSGFEPSHGDVFSFSCKHSQKFFFTPTNSNMPASLHNSEL